MRYIHTDHAATLSDQATKLPQHKQSIGRLDTTLSQMLRMATLLHSPYRAAAHYPRAAGPTSPQRADPKPGRPSPSGVVPAYLQHASLLCAPTAANSSRGHSSLRHSCSGHTLCYHPAAAGHWSHVSFAAVPFRTVWTATK